MARAAASIQKEFQPVVLTLTFESDAELRAAQCLFAHDASVPAAICADGGSRAEAMVAILQAGHLALARAKP
jgi:hypothetical protein